MQPPAAEHEMASLSPALAARASRRRVIDLGRSKSDSACAAACCCETLALCVCGLSCLPFALLYGCCCRPERSFTGVAHCVTFDYSARIVILNEYTRRFASAAWTPGREQKLPFEKIAGFWSIAIRSAATGVSWFQPVVALKGYVGNYNWVLNESRTMYWNEQGDAVLPLIFHGRFRGRMRRRLNGVLVDDNPGADSASATAAGVDVGVPNYNENRTAPARYHRVRFYMNVEDLEPRLRLLNEFLRGRPVADWELRPPARASELPPKSASSTAQPRTDSSNSSDSVHASDVVLAMQTTGARIHTSLSLYGNFFQATALAGIAHPPATLHTASPSDIGFDFAYIDSLCAPIRPCSRLPRATVMTRSSAGLCLLTSAGNAVIRSGIHPMRRAAKNVNPAAI